MGIKLLVLAGLPSCGKTTVGKDVAKDLDMEFLRESAEYLIDDGYGPGAYASEEFDQKILEYELNRDQELLMAKGAGFIVESWHIGNYSYCLARNSAIAKKYEEVLNNSGKIFDVVCLFLKISPELSAYRCREFKWAGRNEVRKAQFHTIEFLQNLNRCLQYVREESRIKTFGIDSSKSITDVTMAARNRAVDFFTHPSVVTVPREI